ncbi:hypothetical protein Mpsy_2543 [Methanolobus psychrophilus R15]|nr:hypothetical protein Mpsy_2543 [Methanolobus psychrophilus R15]
MILIVAATSPIEFTSRAYKAAFRACVRIALLSAAFTSSKLLAAYRAREACKSNLYEPFIACSTILNFVYHLNSPLSVISDQYNTEKFSMSMISVHKRYVI